MLLYKQPPQEGSWLTVKCTVPHSNERTGKTWEKDVLFPLSIVGTVDTACIDEGTAALLTGFVRALRPTCILETGTHRGRSTRAIAEGLYLNGEGHIWTVDPQDYGVMTYGAIRDHEKPFVTPIIGKTPEVFEEEPLMSLQNIDFAFLDGAHDREGLLADLAYVKTHRASECTVIVENAADPGWPELEELFKTYNEHPHILLSTVTGLQVMTLR